MDWELTARIALGAKSDSWIVSTSLDKPGPETRQFIRSHVMRGKNTRKDRRYRSFVRLMAEDDAEPPSRRSFQQTSAPGDAGDLVVSTPRKIATELSLYGYKIEMRPYMLDLIYRAFTIIKPSSYTVEDALVDNKSSGLFCFDSLSQSPAMIHSVLFTAQAFRDLLLGTPSGRVAQMHLAQALYHLQRSLNDPKIATTKTTMAVVISLATTAAYLGDFGTAKKHMDGLYQMVTLRGGLDSLGYGSMEKYKAQKYGHRKPETSCAGLAARANGENRIDFGLALATGCETRFFREEATCSPGATSYQAAAGLPGPSVKGFAKDPRLQGLWADLQGFSRAANEATRTGVKMPTNFFLEFFTSAPGQLVNLQLHPGSADELLRLSMLGYLKSLLIRVEGVSMRMEFLANRLKATVLAQQSSDTPAPEKILLWALVIAALSMFDDSDESWLRGMLVRTASSLGLRTWADIRNVLKKILWIDIVFDDPGLRLFDRWIAKEWVSDPV